MKLTILTALLAVSAFAQSAKVPPATVAIPLKPIRVSLCFKVISMQRGQVVTSASTISVRALGAAVPNFEVIAENTCPYFVPVAWVTVKFFDANGYRRGMALWGAASVALGEKIRHSFALPDWIPDDYTRIEVAMISTDMKEACEFAPQSCVDGIQSKTPMDAFIPYLRIKP